MICFCLVHKCSDCLDSRPSTADFMRTNTFQLHKCKNEERNVHENFSVVLVGRGV